VAARAESTRAHGISIASGLIFSLTGKFRNAIRINAALWSPRTARAVQILGELARQQRDRSGLSA